MEAGKEKRYDIRERLLDFSVCVINVVEALPRTYTGNHIASQLIRSGTAGAANYGEAQGAESRKDFIHKMKICLKELRETQVQLSIIQRKILVKTKEEMNAVITECEELISIFVASIKTAERNKNKVP